jgi:hypothetical protein
MGMKRMVQVVFEGECPYCFRRDHLTRSSGAFGLDVVLCPEMPSGRVILGPDAHGEFLTIDGGGTGAAGQED